MKTADEIKTFLELNHIREDTPITGKSCAVLIEKYLSQFKAEPLPEINTPFFGNSGATIPVKQALPEISGLDINKEAIEQSLNEYEPYETYKIHAYQKGFIRCVDWYRDELKKRQ